MRHITKVLGPRAIVKCRWLLLWVNLVRTVSLSLYNICLARKMYCIFAPARTSGSEKEALWTKLVVSSLLLGWFTVLDGLLQEVICYMGGNILQEVSCHGRYFAVTGGFYQTLVYCLRLFAVGGSLLYVIDCCGRSFTVEGVYSENCSV